MQGLLKFLAWVCGIIATLCAVIYVTLFDVWTAPTDDPQFVVSIEPTLTAGDTLLISRRGAPTVPDLVRCDDPDAPGRFVVGRIVATARDKVVISGEGLTINRSHTPAPRGCLVGNVVLHNPATGDEEELTCVQQEFGGITFDALALAAHPEPDRSSDVPDGRVYLVSDNRHMHLDSRDFNAVAPETCKRIVFRLWSKQGWGDAPRRFSYIP